GNVASAGDVTLITTTGGIALDANLTGGTVTLTSSGTISQDSTTSVITATELTGSSASGTTLGGANLIGTLGAFTNTGAGGFTLVDAEALDVPGVVDAGSGQ